MQYPIEEKRYMCSELVNVLYEDSSRNTRKAVANLEEISAITASLLSEEALAPGMPISFCAQGHDLYGVVESSDFHPILGWFSKVKLDRFSRWHVRLFVPEHMLALCASARCEETEHVTSRAG